MRILTAFKAFFAILGKRETAKRIEEILASPESSPESSTPLLNAEPISSTETEKQVAKSTSRSSSKTAKKSNAAQSEAITLLAALQREARFIDFIKESLSDYSAEEIGAACLNVHDQCANVLERFFEIRPLSEATEGETLTVESVDPARCLLSGKVQNASQPTGLLVHAGWIAQKCELPQWVGDSKDANVLAPFEVEIQ